MIRFALVLSMLMGCGPTKDDAHAPWYPHVPTAWTVTPAGHTRDAGPFGSVEAGYLTDAEIDADIDAQFAHFETALGIVPPNLPVAINDDYVMWSLGARTWCAGEEITGDRMVHVVLWTRVETPSDPGPCWIARPPGVSWGVEYTVWRHTAKPLCPAVAHELLHAVIGDPGHTSPLWAKL